MADPPFRLVGVPEPGGIVCVADHASNRVPADIALGIPPELLWQHVALDIGVEGVAVHLAERHGVAAFLATISRLVCDLHRREDEASVVPVTSDGHAIPGNRGADIEARLTRFHRPYHRALADWIAAARPALVLSLHSFTPRLASSDEPRPWQVSLLYNRDDRAARIAMQLFREEGLIVGNNEPYSGRQLNATMDRHAEAHGRPYCTIEIRQDCIGTRGQQADWADRIARVAREVQLRLATG
jgi:predicted N-formylglutamate amidohydrolase